MTSEVFFELGYAKDRFDVEAFNKLSKSHTVELVIGEDGRYNCIIDREVFAQGLTPMFTLVYGIENFHRPKKNNI